MTEYIFLIDCDNFFVSCERLFRPDLQKKPVLVLSSNDGCVISRSQEVKNLGIGMGEPYFKIRDLCEKNTVFLFSTNFELYRDISARVMSVLRRFSDTVEVYSVDEAFLTFSVSQNAEAILLEKAKEVRFAVMREIGVPVSVGVAVTKTLAKVATHFAKPKHSTNGCFVLVDTDLIHESLKKLEIGDVWGIGRRLASKLAKAGVHTAFDFYSKTYPWIQAQTSILGVRTARELHGVRQLAVGEDAELRKSLLHSQSFGSAVHCLIDLQTSVAYHARKVAEILRKEGALAREVSIFLYRKCTNGKREKVLGSEILGTYTNSTLIIVATTLTVLARLYVPEHSYTKAGVYVKSIVPEGGQPRSTLFGEYTNTHQEIMTAVDDLRSRYGDVIHTGLETRASKSQAHSNHLSPRRTTRWGEVLHIGLT
ncbi:TPA: DNA polymerase V UmuC [Patescibacteria group bacterium]|nr:MAG: DNA-directed DNA polymerase [Parcubacteria group bacterium GW2011_GWD2_42_14]HCC05668.1 DNA polymerase V UmuC [Patescibacteria group bacterium]